MLALLRDREMPGALSPQPGQAFGCVARREAAAGCRVRRGQPSAKAGQRLLEDVRGGLRFHAPSITAREADSRCIPLAPLFLQVTI